jgi:hypothetical protein
MGLGAAHAVPCSNVNIAGCAFDSRQSAIGSVFCVEVEDALLLAEGTEV